jgi:hypothetical protein
MAQRDVQGPKAVRVYLESGQRRTFAMAVDWPGWGRSGKTDETALEALQAYRDRYAVVAKAARQRLPGSSGLSLEVVATVPGNATTEFGAPGVIPEIDLDRTAGSAAWDLARARRQTALLQAAWRALDDAAAAAPAQLRTGPRGGGRSLEKIVDHVLSTEPAYARKAGLKIKVPAGRAGVDLLRDRLMEHLLTLAELTDRATDVAESPAAAWPASYTVRRLAWHALDHAWEIEDRS